MNHVLNSPERQKSTKTKEGYVSKRFLKPISMKRQKKLYRVLNSPQKLKSTKEKIEKNKGNISKCFPYLK